MNIKNNTITRLSVGFAFLFIQSVFCWGQIKDPVSISYSSKKIAENTYDLIASLRIASPWHVYALKGGDGPVSTSFEVYKAKENQWITVIGKTTERGKIIKKYEEVFKSDVAYFENKAEFIIRIKKDAKKKSLCVPIALEYMVCNDSECLPPTTKSTCIVVK